MYLPAERGNAAGFRWRIRELFPDKRRDGDLAARLMADLPSIVLLVDGGGRIVHFNPHLSAVSGYGANELSAREWAQLMIPPDRAAARDLLERVRSSRVPESAVLSLKMNDGRERVITWSGKVLTYVDGTQGVVFSGQDMTDLQREVQETLRANSMAAVGRVVEGLAHESRNVLQRAQGSLSILELRLRDRPEELAILRRLQQAQDDLTHLFGCASTYAAPIRLTPRECDLRELWREAWAEFGPFPVENAPELLERVDADARLVADPLRLKLAFRHLFENALDAVIPARVEVHLSATAFDGREMMEVAVRDNGPLMSREEAERLFEPFRQAGSRGGRAWAGAV
jgi:PAS domain S-box-containing protein